MEWNESNTDDCNQNVFGKEKEYEIETTESIEKIVEKVTIFEKMMRISGSCRIEAKIFSLLFFSNRPLAGRFIEKTMDLRQSELSLGIKNLQARGWVREIPNNKGSRKGRPEKIFELAMRRENIIEEIETTIYKDYMEKMETLGELIKEKEKEVI